MAARLANAERSADHLIVACARQTGDLASEILSILAQAYAAAGHYECDQMSIFPAISIASSSSMPR